MGEHGDKVARRISRRTFRERFLPYRRFVPYQRADTDGPYCSWRWRGRELFRRPWPKGRTKEQFEQYVREARGG